MVRGVVLGLTPKAAQVSEDSLAQKGASIMSLAVSSSCVLNPQAGACGSSGLFQSDLGCESLAMLVDGLISLENSEKLINLRLHDHKYGHVSKKSKTKE